MNAPLSRVSKLFVDRDAMTPDEVIKRRQQNEVLLKCGPDVARSYTLQLALLTAARLASRCFPGAVKVALGDGADAPLLLWPSLKRTLGQAAAEMLGNNAMVDGYDKDVPSLLFGDAPAAKNALRVTFDGWIGKAGPAGSVERMPEREYCSLAGLLAASLGVSELFLSFADISIEAGRREVSLSLWQPDLEVGDPRALGIQAQFLPDELWVLGLGHLGNAYLWALATLPYAERDGVELFLNDFDKIEPENIETGILFNAQDVGHFKTRVCAHWLESRGFRTRIVERRFDSAFRCRMDEARLALCGFDSNPSRRDLPDAAFLRVIESGLGGKADNFDAISVHAWPNPRSAMELWPDIPAEEEARELERRTRMARDNPAYASLDRDECGRYSLAGQSVAVPFVGCVSSCLVVAELLRLLHGGPAYTDFKLRLATPAFRSGNNARDYDPEEAAGVKYGKAADATN